MDFLPAGSAINGNAYFGLPTNFRFGVFILSSDRVPLPDFRFQRVSGLSTRLDTRNIDEGGHNHSSHRLPHRLQHDNLVLERGMVVGSLLNAPLNSQLSRLQVFPATILVVLFSEETPDLGHVPVRAWWLYRAYPVRWATADLDASSPQLLIETIEFAYTRMQPMVI